MPRLLLRGCRLSRARMALAASSSLVAAASASSRCEGSDLDNKGLQRQSSLLYEKLGYHGTWAGAFSRIDTNNDGKLQKNEVRVEANPCARLLCWPRGKSANRCWRFCSRIGSMCQAENSTICGMRPHSTVKTRMLSPKQSSRRGPPLRTPTPATLACLRGPNGASFTGIHGAHAPIVYARALDIDERGP